MKGKVCCLGSNKCWLLFIVTLNIITCLLEMAAVGLGIWFIDQLIDWGKENSIIVYGWETGRRAVYLAAMWIIFISGFRAFLVETLPIRAEVNQNPRILQVYRNWKLVEFAFQALIVAYFVLFQLEHEITKKVLLFLSSLTVMILFTIVLVRRRTQEMEDDIGSRVRTRPLDLDEL